MSDVNFILREMTHLRYWAPLVKEARSRGLQSTLYMARSDKYNCPYIGKNKQELESFCEENKINILKAKQAANATGLLFASENRWGIDILKTAKNATKIVCTYQTDFVESYNVFYKDVADYVLMPSKFCAEFYRCTDANNLYLGIPKYDIDFTKDDVYKKHNIPKDGKKALVVWPKTRDYGRVDVGRIMQILHNDGYTIFIKTRGKDPLAPETIKQIKKAGDFYFEDSTWYPHTTQELLEVSDVVVNFGSTTVEECVMHEVPLINFDVKPKTRHGNTKEWRVTHDYLYDYEYCVQMRRDFKDKELEIALNYLAGAKDLSKEFKKARQNHLFDHTNSSKKILDFLLKKKQ